MLFTGLFFLLLLLTTRRLKQHIVVTLKITLFSPGFVFVLFFVIIVAVFYSLVTFLDQFYKVYSLSRVGFEVCLVSLMSVNE